MREYIEKEKAVGIAYEYCHTKDGKCCGPDDVVELWEELKAMPSSTNGLSLDDYKDDIRLTIQSAQLTLSCEDYEAFCEYVQECLEGQV